MEQVTPPMPVQPKKGNAMGVTGFVLSLVTLILGWIPVLGWILWALGLIFSCIGLGKQPRGLAIAGLCISIFGIICLVVLFAALGIASASLL